MYRRVGHLAEPAADREDEVRVVQPRCDPLVHRDAEDADVARRAVVDEVLAAERARDRERARLAEGEDVAARLRRPATFADDDQRALRGGEQLAHATELLRARRDARRLDRRRIGDVGLLREHVLGQREHDRAGPPRHGERDRLGEVLRDALRRVDLPRRLRDPPEDPRVVELLPGLASAKRARDLADEEEHRRRVLAGGVHADRRLGRARPARDEADARSPRELADRFRRVRRALLVAAGDEPDRRVVERVEHREVALARDAEGKLDPVSLELVDEDPAARPHSRSGSSSSTVARCSRGLSSSAGSR